jgi:hypothetical protein
LKLRCHDVLFDPEGYTREEDQKHPYTAEEEKREREYLIKTYGANLFAACAAMQREMDEDVYYCTGHHINCVGQIVECPFTEPDAHPARKF